jgi:hypothetical protein
MLVTVFCVAGVAYAANAGEQAPTVWLGALLAVAGVFLTATITLEWAKRNGEALGIKVGKYLPGEKVETWLIEFLQAFVKGLAQTNTPISVDLQTEPGKITLGIKRFI